LNLAAAQIRWLFFDLGNTLISEAAATERRMEQLADCFARQGRRCSVDDIRRALQQASAEFAPRLITAAIDKLTDDPELRQSVMADARYPKELEAPYDDADEALRTLSSRYRIGVIANQPAGTEERPPPCACPRRMRARRSGNDRRSARQRHPPRPLAGKTIRVLQGFARFQSPRDAFDKADASVAKIEEFIPLLLRSGQRS
jgi:hypothetical protein